MGRVPSRGSDQFVLRMPEGMRDRLRDVAEANGRSMNSEIVSKLQRYDSLGGEVDAMWEVARAIASAIDEAVGPEARYGTLLDKVNEAFNAVDEDGNVDKAKLFRDFAAQAGFRLEDVAKGGVRLPAALRERIEAKADTNGRSVETEVLSTLEREYPPLSDVMHIHLDNIRHALSLYERETDPQARMRLQSLVEAMVTSGHNLEIDWEDEEK